MVSACTSETEFKKIKKHSLIGGMEVNEYFHEKSGLQVFMHPKPGIKQIVYVTAFRVGSRHEEPGKTGLAHLFEHMMFKDTKNFKNPNLLHTRWGGYINAYTSFDLTLYIESFAKSVFEEVVAYEADRMRNLQMTEKMYKTERGAVVSERKRGYEDRATGKLYWELFKLAFDKHPYKTLPIGHQKDLDASTLADANAFYKKFYAPNRAVIIIVGDFKEKQALKLLSKNYGKFEKEEWIEPVIPAEPKRTKLRRKEIAAQTQTVYVADAHLGYTFEQSELPSEVLMCDLLTSPGNGYLYFALVEKGIAKSVGGDCTGSVDPNLSLIYAQGNPGVSKDKLEKEYLAALKGFPAWLDEKKLRRLKKYYLANRWEKLRSPTSLATELGDSAVTTGDPFYSFNFLKKIDTVSLTDIKLRFNSMSSRNPTRIILKPNKGSK